MQIVLKDIENIGFAMIEAWALDFNFTEENDMRTKVTLACSECKQRNYVTMKNKKNNPDRVEFKKYCPFCKKHTMHKETK